MRMNAYVHRVDVTNETRYVAVCVSVDEKAPPTAAPVKGVIARTAKKPPLTRNTTARKYAEYLTELVLCTKRARATKNDIAAIATDIFTRRSTKSLSKYVK